MEVSVNMKLLNERAVSKISEKVAAIGVHLSHPYELMAIRMPSGSVLVAETISSLNPLAPPSLQIRGKDNHSEDNRSTAKKIVKKLTPACKSKHLPEAVKMMKAAINQLSN